MVSSCCQLSWLLTSSRLAAKLNFNEQSTIHRQLTSKLDNYLSAVALVCHMPKSSYPRVSVVNDQSSAQVHCGQCNQQSRRLLMNNQYVDCSPPKDMWRHGLVGWGHIQSTPSPCVYMDATFIPPTFCLYSSGSLIVEQLLPLGNRGELEGTLCEFEFGFIAPHRLTWIIRTYIFHSKHDTINHCGRFLFLFFVSLFSNMR